MFLSIEVKCVYSISLNQCCRAKYLQQFRYNAASYSKQCLVKIEYLDKIGSLIQLYYVALKTFFSL